MEWLAENYVALLKYGVPAILGLAAAVVRFTETPKDDEYVNKIQALAYKIIEAIVGKVK